MTPFWDFWANYILLKTLLSVSNQFLYNYKIQKKTKNYSNSTLIHKTFLMTKFCLNFWANPMLLKISLKTIKIRRKGWILLNFKYRVVRQWQIFRWPPGTSGSPPWWVPGFFTLKKIILLKKSVIDGPPDIFFQIDNVKNQVQYHNILETMN